MSGVLGRSLCSRNARPQKALVGRAQLGSSQVPLSGSLPAASLDELFEHPVRCVLFCTVTFPETPPQ